SSDVCSSDLPQYFNIQPDKCHQKSPSGQPFFFFWSFVFVFFYIVKIQKQCQRGKNSCQDIKKYGKPRGSPKKGFNPKKAKDPRHKIYYKNAGTSCNDNTP